MSVARNKFHANLLNLGGLLNFGQVKDAWPDLNLNLASAAAHWRLRRFPWGKWCVYCCLSAPEATISPHSYSWEFQLPRHCMNCFGSAKVKGAETFWKVLWWSCAAGEWESIWQQQPSLLLRSTKLHLHCCAVEIVSACWFQSGRWETGQHGGGAVILAGLDVSRNCNLFIIIKAGLMSGLV